MSQNYSTQERLRILRLSDHERRWYSVDDKRLCLICERIISGRQIEISGGPKEYALACPTPDCPGTFSHWFLYRPSDIRPQMSSIEGTGEIDFLSDFAGPETQL